MSIITGIRYKIFKNGVVCPGGKLHTSISGTSTPLAVFTDAALTSPATNPVVMDSNGEAVIYLDPTKTYRFADHDASDVLIKTPVDGITDVNFSSTSGVSSGFNKNVRASTTGLSSIITITADQVVLQNSSGDSVVAFNVSESINIASLGVNGLDTGTLAADKWYAIYLIAAVSGGTISSLDACASASFNAPSVTGYTHYYRVGAKKTDGTANKYLLNSMIRDREFQYKVEAGTNVTGLPTIASGVLGNIGAPTWTAQTVRGATTQAAPTTATRAKLVTSTTSGTVIVAPSNYYGSSTSTTNPPPVRTGAVSLADFILESDSVYYACDSGNGRLQLLGFTDGV